MSLNRGCRPLRPRFVHFQSWPPLLAALAVGLPDRPALARPDRGTLGPLVKRRLRRHARLDLAGHGHERLLDVGGVLRRSLQERDANLIGKRLRRLVVHRPLRREVALVTHQQLVHVLVGVPVDLVEPLLDVVEGLRVRHVVHHDDAVSAAVVGRGDRPETLLARGVPDL